MRATNTFASCSHGSKALPCPKRRSSRLVSIKHSRGGADAELRRDESVQSGERIIGGERIITVYPARLLNLGRSCKFVQRSSHAKGLRRRACTTSGEVVTKFQSDSSRTDSPVRILDAQPGSRFARAPLRPVIRPISPIVVWGRGCARAPSRKLRIITSDFGRPKY
jgi:hypothetical protein